MDAIVQQIFTVMTAGECFPVDMRFDPPPDLHARIVFLRSCCKTCEILLTHEDADALTRLLTGSDSVDLREDVACELCNMIAGGWKTRRCAEGLPIAMLPPQVCAHHPAEFCNGCATCFCGTYGFGKTYGFSNAQFTVRLCCNEMH
jgi:chemotaxis protein CheX